MDTKGTMKNEKATREIKQDTSIIKLNSLIIYMLSHEVSFLHLKKVHVHCIVGLITAS